MSWCMMSHWNTSQVCSTSHHIGLHHCFAILPSPGLQLQMANFHSDAIVSVLELIHVQESLLQACPPSMPWCMMSPLKYFSHKCVALLTTLGYTVLRFCHSTLSRPQNGELSSSTCLVANCLMLRGVDRQYGLIMDDIKVTLVLQGKSLYDCGLSNLTQ